MRKDRMNLLVGASAAVLLGAISVGPALAQTVIYDSKGFEPGTFDLGPLNGQNGWYGEAADGGVEPMVVAAPDPVIGTQAVRLENDDFQGSYSYADLATSDLVADGYQTVTVKFDVYRETSDWLSNLWWWWFDAGEPTYGIQWDEANGFPGGTYPFGWVDGAFGTETIHDEYCTVEMTWKLADGTAECFYNGEFVCEVFIVDINSLTGWAFQLAHDEATGTGPETLWIDNFIITGSKGDEFTLTVDPDPLIGGSKATFTATNGQPGAKTYLAYSLAGAGQTYVPMLNVTLDMRKPQQAGKAINANGSGTAVWNLPVTRKAIGRNVWLQAVQFENKTNLVATSVQ